MLAVYFTLGNSPAHIRYNINNIQLVLLCKEKEYSHEKVYRRIIEDLIKIDDRGIEIFPNKIVKDSLIFISNDNLGAHGIGGFCENFSVSNYFCRFCLCTRKNFLGVKHKKLTTLVEKEIENDENINNDDENVGVLNETENEDEDIEKEEIYESENEREDEEIETISDDSEKDEIEEMYDESENESEDMENEELSDESENENKGMGTEELSDESENEKEDEENENDYKRTSYKRRDVASYLESLRKKEMQNFTRALNLIQFSINYCGFTFVTLDYHHV